jgi:hypothetical protein
MVNVGIVSRGLGGLKEYIYRGLQQLPIVLASTSLIYTIATGSIAHLNIFLGMTFVIPFVTWLLQIIIGFISNRLLPGSILLQRSGGDTCDLIPPLTPPDRKDYERFFVSLATKEKRYEGFIPSFWLMEVAFFIGYALSNGVDSLLIPAEQGSSDVNNEKRNTQAMIVIFTTTIFAFIVLVMRFVFMSSCEGTGTWGYIISILCAIGAAGIGYGMYMFSRICGARCSDLFGILSQILPQSSTTPHPIVCKEG